MDIYRTLSELADDLIEWSYFEGVKAPAAPMSAMDVWRDAILEARDCPRIRTEKLKYTLRDVQRRIQMADQIRLGYVAATEAGTYSGMGVQLYEDRVALYQKVEGGIQKVMGQLKELYDLLSSS